MKLELKHLAPYLPYGLKWVFDGDDTVHEVSGLDINTFGVQLISDDDFGRCTLENGKPILRPLSSMAKKEAYEFGILLMGEADMEDKEVGIGDMTLMGNTHPVIMYQDQEDEDYSVMVQFGSTGISVSGMNLIPHEAYQWLFSHHFDVFNLINSNLAINKDEL